LHAVNAAGTVHCLAPHVDSSADATQCDGMFVCSKLTVSCFVIAVASGGRLSGSSDAKNALRMSAAQTRRHLSHCSALTASSLLSQHSTAESDIRSALTLHRNESVRREHHAASVAVSAAAVSASRMLVFSMRCWSRSQLGHFTCRPVRRAHPLSHAAAGRHTHRAMDSTHRITA
jgi:hypothetical protein